MKRFILVLFLIFLSLPAYGVTRIYDRSTGDIVDADKDDAEWDNTNSAINTHTADTSAHDATGGVVGVSKVQTLTNKTLTSPTITTSPTASGATWADLGTATIFRSTSSAITNLTITNLNGTISANSGVVLSFFSGVADNLKASINGSTGKFIGYFLNQGTYNLDMVRATTSVAGDSIKVQCGGAACSVTNPGFVVMPSTTAGALTGFIVTADVTINLTGAHWAADTTGDLTGRILRLIFDNDNGTLRTCVGLLGGRQTLLTTNTNATASNIDLAEEVLCDTAVGSATNTAMEAGYFRSDFDDTGGSSENLNTIQSGVNDIVMGQSADGLWQPWNIVYGGFSANPTAVSSRWTQNGRNITVNHKRNATGTSNATSKTATLPVKAGYRFDIASGSGLDNGSVITSSLLLESAAGSATMSIFANAGGGNWTGSGDAAFDFSLTYEAGPVASFIE